MLKTHTRCIQVQYFLRYIWDKIQIKQTNFDQLSISPSQSPLQDRKVNGLMKVQFKQYRKVDGVALWIAVPS